MANLTLDLRLAVNEKAMIEASLREKRVEIELLKRGINPVVVREAIEAARDGK